MNHDDLTLVHRHLALARDGQRWLLLKVADPGSAAQGADAARAPAAPARRRHARLSAAKPQWISRSSTAATCSARACW